MQNAYPELPALPYMRTTVLMKQVIADLQAIEGADEVKRMAYIMFRNEGANGGSGVHHNYIGAQADSGRWPDRLTPFIAGTIYTKENGTGEDRIFLAFRDVDGCLRFLIERVQGRGLYIGGTPHLVLKGAWTITSPRDLCRAYTKEWVKGSAAAEPDAAALAGFLSMYAQAEGFFPKAPSA